MRIEESSDGTVRVVELDPAKWYWIILDDDTDVQWPIKKVDGQILIKRHGSEITFVENPDRLEDKPAGVTERDDGRRPPD